MPKRLDDEYPVRPFADSADFDRAGDWFREAGFIAGVLHTELGINDTIPPGSVEGSALQHRLTVTGPRHLLLRLFVLGQPLTAAEAREALGPVAPERWRATGVLIDHEGGYRCPLHLLPLPRGEDGWCVGDSSDFHDRPDFVSGPTESTILLAQLMVRRPARSLLDLGTGSGYLALVAAGFVEEVVATDLCPRAVPLTRFNAHLNGRDNIVALEGSLFDPVAGRRFDRIVANAPFILGPGTGHLYRDAGDGVDGIAWRMARGAPGHLEEGGFLHLLAHWPLRRGEKSAPRLEEWLGGLGCDAWVMIQARLPAADYTRANLMELHYPRSPEYVEAYVRGIDYFAAEGVEEIGLGALTLRRRSGAQNWLHIEDSPRLLGNCGEDVARGFEARDLLAGDPDGTGLLGARLVVEEGLELHQDAVIGEGGTWENRAAEFRRTRGLGYVGNTDPVAAGLLVRCDGSATIAELIEGLARASGQPVDSVREPALAALRTMIELGFVRVQ